MAGEGPDIRRTGLRTSSSFGFVVNQIDSSQDDQAGVEQSAMRVLLALFPRIDGFAERTRTREGMLAAVDGSDLHADDARSEPFHVSTMAAVAIGVAVDHLEMLKGTTNPSGDLDTPSLTFHMGAHWTLLRAALENTSKAIWLLGSADSDERITRALRLQVDNIKHSDDAAKVLGAKMFQPRAERLHRVKEIAKGCGISATKAQERIKYPELVRYAGDFRQDDLANLMEFLWRACSGAAHGDGWAVLSLQNRKIIDQLNPGLGLVQLGPDIVALAQVTGVVVEAVEAAIGLFDHRNHVAEVDAA